MKESDQTIMKENKKVKRDQNKKESERVKQTMHKKANKQERECEIEWARERIMKEGERARTSNETEQESKV